MSNESTVSFKIVARTQGQESVQDLTQHLDDLAKVLDGDVAAQARSAADRLRELAAQQEAIATFERLRQEAAEAAAALKRAEAEASNFGQQIGQAGPATAREAEALQRLQAAAAAARGEMTRQRTAMTEATAALQGYGVSTKNTGDAQQRLTAEVEQVRASVAHLAPAYDGAARGAVAAGGQIQRSHRAIGEGVESISTQLGRVQNAFIALQGGGFLTGLIKDAALTADAYNSLAARIRLATGEGAAFRTGLEGVQQIALATRSSLEATGELFAKLTQAGQALDISQTDALALTQTINQAIQVSGGSAQAAEAAITQLGQALQSGVLRGDEFNSMMEQSPRLTRALADGLGVGVGRLREMAEQGQLTAETVVKALKGQSEAVAAEFAQLPPTVGGALQNLSTAWTLYVGKVDQASGASRTAAEAIAYLADHLDGIVGTVAEVGKGVAALQLIKLAAHFQGWALGAGQATAALAAHTGATVADTAATQAHTAATTADAAAARAQAGAVAASGVAAAGAAVQKGLLSTAMVGLAAAGRGVLGLLGGPAGLLALTAVYAKDLGELAAKLVLKARGLQTVEEAERDLAEQEKRSDAQAQALAHARAQQAQADKDAAEAKFGLSDAAKTLVREFDEARKSGQSADEAITAIGKKFDLSSVPGVRAAAGVLDRLAADGKASAEQVQQAWAQALDGKDLQKFEVLARAALQGAERSATQLGQALDAQLREAVKRTGLDMALISGGMSQASVSAMNDVETIIAGLDSLKASGADAALALSTSLAKALNAADSQKALDALKLRIEGLRGELGDTVTDGLLAQAAQQARTLKDRLDDLKPGINSVDEALKAFGLQTRADMQKTADTLGAAWKRIASEARVSIADKQEAFEKYAQAVVKANGGVVSAEMEVQAAALGLKLVVDEAGRVWVQKLNEAAAALGQITGYYAGIGESLNSVRELQDLLTAATLRQRDAIDAAVEAQNRLLDSVAAEKALRDRIRNTDANGFSKDATGTTVVNAEGATPLSILNVLKGYGLTDGQAAAAARQFTNNGQVVFSNQYNAGTLSEALRRAAEAVLLSQGVNAGASSGGSSTGSSGSTGSSAGSGSDVVTLPGSGGSGPGINTDRYSSAQSGGVTAEQLQALIDAARSQSAPQVVQVTLPNGQVARVGTASAADSAALVGLLGAVQADARRAM